MPIVTLVSRQLRNAPFWGQILTRLSNVHHLDMRPINITPSTPGDLTFPQLKLALLFIDTKKLDDDLVHRIDGLLEKARKVVVVVRCDRDSRAWEEIQLQLVVGRLSVVVLSALSTKSAAESIAAFVESFVASVHPYPPDATEAAELLRCLDLEDAQLQFVYQQTRCLSDLATIIESQDNRSYWVEQLGETIVEAIEYLLFPND